MHPSPDDYCGEPGPRGHCTELEMVTAQPDVQEHWNHYPEWLRALCARSSTMGSWANCETDKTMHFLDAHPDVKPYWTGMLPDPHAAK